MAAETQPLLADLAAEAVAATEIVPVVDVPPRAPAEATVVSFTVTYGGDEGFDPVRTVVVADLPEGVRTAATCEDAATAHLAITDRPHRTHDLGAGHDVQPVSAQPSADRGPA